MKNIFVLVTILGHLPVILSAKRKGSDNMKHILIVEDDNLLNKTLTYNLELDGYTITSVLNARTAAESLKTNIFDLVLLDINLPDGNGYDLCRLIKPEHPDTVVIFLTANDQESNQIRGYEAGAVDYITKPFSISALQRKIKAMFAMSSIVYAAEKKEIAVSVDCPENLIISHDSKWTSEALFNLLDNAVKYTPSGGKISVSVVQWEMYVEVKVTDTGKGISESNQAAIFRRFYREEEVHDQQGVGIGLYLAREIVTRQGGYIKVVSELRQGSEFSIMLPVR
nr:TMAO_torS: TMAO reductase sytem sensor [uncultured bacterium]